MFTDLMYQFYGILIFLTISISCVFIYLWYDENQKYNVKKCKSFQTKFLKLNFAFLHTFSFPFYFILNEWIQFVHTPPTTSLVPPLLLWDLCTTSNRFAKYNWNLLSIRIGVVECFHMFYGAFVGFCCWNTEKFKPSF